MDCNAIFTRTKELRRETRIIDDAIRLGARNTARLALTVIKMHIQALEAHINDDCASQQNKI